MNKNFQLANIFKKIAVYLKMDDIPFKPEAYQKAALGLETMAESVEEIYKKEGKEGLLNIPGVGESIAEKIIEFLKTGKIKEFEEQKKKIPVDLDELMSVEGLGPKTIKALYEYLKIKNLKDLEKAAQEGKIRKLENFGEKSEKNILQAIEFLERSKGRFLISEALSVAEKIIEELKKLKEIEQISLAGSLRRKKETIGDIDFLATVKKGYPHGAKKIMDAFTNMEGTIKIWDYGLTKSSVRFDLGIDADLRVVKDYEFGAALQYFTGSKEHNIITRKIALEKGLKLNEYGLFKKVKSLSQKSKDIRYQWKRISGETEEEIYKSLGLSYIEPELRENTGEIEAARAHQLPKIIGYNEIRGDLHCHSDWDGGENSIEQMAMVAMKMGYEYLGVSDHTKFLRIEKGLDEQQLLAQHKAIEKLNTKIQNTGYKIQILHGCEANILNDGSLDINNEVLSQLDYVIAGVHSQMKMAKDEMTERIIRAMKNPNANIISHPTGRLINRRDEYQIDFDKILRAAKEYQVALEINAFPDRLDLNDKNIRKAVASGVKMVINTDSHHQGQLRFINFGIAQARRGWATKKDIINSWEIEKLLSFFQSEQKIKGRNQK
ncbi:MAG: DNA polymerase/3'-5' exonuclease PolX [Candidatus Pacebacteria bacterium]|nr:DNA polymerase/3'-5' exonuclease PolX [Candidatus Paceibacterota bacterium]